MTDEQPEPTAAAEDAVVLITDLEREVLTTLDVFTKDLDVAIAEYETSRSGVGEQPNGRDPIGMPYRDARNLKATASGLETRIRQLGARYRDDLIEARQEAAVRAQEPFNGNERAMLRKAIADYGEALTKEGKRLSDLARPRQARELVADASILLERIAPLFAEQHELKSDHGPLFAGGKSRVTEAGLAEESEMEADTTGPEDSAGDDADDGEES